MIRRKEILGCHILKKKSWLAKQLQQILERCRSQPLSDRPLNLSYRLQSLRLLDTRHSQTQMDPLLIFRDFVRDKKQVTLRDGNVVFDNLAFPA